jgi:hypothetical protein
VGIARNYLKTDICKIKFKQGVYKANRSPQNRARVKLSLTPKKKLSIGVDKANGPPQNRAWAKLSFSHKKQSTRVGKANCP